MRESAEFDVAEFDNPDSTRGLHARFYYVPKQDAVASAAEGRPIFVDKEYIEIIAPGNQNNIVRRPADARDKAMFRDLYERFKAGDTDQLTGTPLMEVPWLTRGQVEELMYRKVRTLEQLAELSDAACNMPGMYELKRKAKAWLEKAAEAAPFTKMQEEMDKLRAELAALKNTQAADTPAKASK